MHMYVAAIDALPFPEDKKFHDQADVVLSGMRKLRSALSEAAGRGKCSPSVILALSDVRQRYDSLMTRAAAAPGSSLGQQLYAVRIHAGLSAEETANGAALRADLLDDLEAGETPTEEEAGKIRDLISALGGVPGTEHLNPPPVQDAKPDKPAKADKAGKDEQNGNGEALPESWEAELIAQNVG